MKIGIIGSGNMGRVLGLLMAESGHQVRFGSRRPEQAEHAASLATRNAQPASLQGAAEFGEVLVYTVRDTDPAKVLENTDAVAGKTVIDCNNWDIPADFAYAPIEVSLAEKLQTQIPTAHVVKSWNTLAQEVFEHCPNGTREHRIANFICGDHPEARRTAARLSDEMGFDTIDCGPLVRARLIEGQADFIRLLLIQPIRRNAAFAIPAVPAVDAPRFGERL